MVTFNPIKGGQEPSAPAVGEIKDGKYSIDKAQGPVPGKYTISVSSRPPIKIGPGEEPGTRPKQDPEKVPAQYNIKSTLEKEVTSEALNTINFDLKSN
jgi:hypothetical protein